MNEEPKEENKEIVNDEQKLDDDLKEKLIRCEKDRDEYLEGWKRAKADFINYKKEETKRFEELIKFGTAELIQELAAILDSFDFSLTVLKNDEPARKGIFLIKSQFEDFLKKHGFSRIVVSKGDKFNPVLHEAVGEIESEEPEGVILEEVSRGYRLYDKVLKPSRVMVSKIKGQSQIKE
ncbi:MAG: nucleotide exchange factor GrpE [Patescibacteria group bacterium]|nr:nucleotide exchange factor GrpE [Patescibacteria group bacterium]